MKNNKSIIENFFRSDAPFYGRLNLHDLWFFNGTDKNFKINFLRRELYECFKIELYTNGKEITDTDFDYHKKWDLCLIEIFDSKFSIQRTQTGFSISSVHNDLYSSKDDSEIRKIEIETHVISEEELLSKGKSNEKCNYISLGNKKVTIEQADFLIEPTACRFMILYILAKAYYYRLEFYANKISDILFNKRSKYEKFVNLIPIKIKHSELQKIESFYKDYIFFDTRYLFCVPLNITRVHDLANIWDDLYSFYKIKTLNDEVISKINALTLLSRGCHANKLSNYMFLFAILGCSVSVIKLVEIIIAFL